MRQVAHSEHEHTFDISLSGRLCSLYFYRDTLPDRPVPVFHISTVSHDLRRSDAVLVSSYCNACPDGLMRSRFHEVTEIASRVEYAQKTQAER